MAPGLSSTHATVDNNGNTLTSTTGSNTTTYAWDFENRLTSVTLPGSAGTVTFKYDPFGRRIYKSSSSTTSVYAYDGDNLVEETNATGAVVARYEQTQNIDEPLAMLRSGATSYYHADGLGSVTSLSSSAGSIANTYTYDSFGKLTASTGSLVNPFRYTARESDIETGLYYYRARYYDLSTGRFLGEDPIGFDGGANFYSYVSQNPVNGVDPTGLQGPGLVGGTAAGCALGGLPGCAVGAAAGEATDIGLGAAASAMLLAALHNIAQQCHKNECDKLLKEILATMYAIQGRIGELLLDPWNLFNNAYGAPNSAFPDKGSYLGHIHQIEGLQQRLRNLLSKAEAMHCPIPPGAWQVATQRLPNRPWPKKAP